MSYKTKIRPGEIKGYRCAICEAVTDEGQKEVHFAECYVPQIRKQALLDAAETVGDWATRHYDRGVDFITEGVAQLRDDIAEFLREKAEE